MPEAKLRCKFPKSNTVLFSLTVGLRYKRIAVAMKAERLVDQFAKLPFGDSRRSQKFCKSEENFDKNRWPQWEPYDETLVQVSI